MRWQARREETWGQLNPQNWQNVIYRHYCTEGLQKQHVRGVLELNSPDSRRYCSQIFHMCLNPAGHFLQHLASFCGNMNEFIRCSVGEYVDWLKKGLWNKQLKPVILQNPVQIYETTQMFMIPACLAVDGCRGLCVFVPFSKRIRRPGQPPAHPHPGLSCIKHVIQLCKQLGAMLAKNPENNPIDQPKT